MSFNHAYNTSVHRSIFTDVGGGLHIHDGVVQIRIGEMIFNLSLQLPLSDAGHSRIGLPPSHVSHNNSNLPTSSSHPDILFGPSMSSLTALESISISTSLVRQLTDLLTVSQQPLKHMGLRIKLQCLCYALPLIRDEIQEYKDRPLGPGLISVITPEVNRCREVLELAMGIVNHTQQALNPAIIRNLHQWCQVRQSSWDDFTTLEIMLTLSQKGLAGLLMALRSDAWTELGNDLSTGSISLDKFYASLGQLLPPLRHIRLETVSVVDHLGQTIPVPITFCSTWENFNRVITGYCKDRAGNRYVERGDYEIIDAENNKRIGRVELAEKVKPGMVVEMSIILRRTTAVRDNDRTCPKCQHINTNIIVGSDWIKCCRCFAQFQVEQINSSIDDPNNGRGNIMDSNKADGEGFVEGHNETHDGNYEEIISPALEAGTNQTNQEDETQHFCRINVIYMLYAADKTSALGSKSRRKYMAGKVVDWFTRKKPLVTDSNLAASHKHIFDRLKPNLAMIPPIRNWGGFDAAQLTLILKPIHQETEQRMR